MGRTAERGTGAGRPMRRRRVVVEVRGPSTYQWEESDYRLRNMGRGREMKEGLLNGAGVEPHHVAVIVGEFCVVAVVAFRVVRVEMSMNRCVRMIGVGFVQVFAAKSR
jgi:hypothetical protein